MKWLLVVVLMRAADDFGADDFRFEGKRYVTEAACQDVARRVSERFPELEWRGPADSKAITRPVLRSYVDCVPVSED